MGSAASSMPEQIDFDSFRSISGENFNSELFEYLKDENGCITRGLILDLSAINLHLPRFIESIPFFSKYFISCGMLSFSA